MVLPNSIIARSATYETSSVLEFAAASIVLPSGSLVSGAAQSHPTRPVRWLVGFSSGGPQDIMARLMGQWLSERLGQQFIVENRSGAGGNIAVEAVVNAPPDGYTLLMIGPTNAINTTLYDKLNFDFVRDIRPVAGIARVPLILEVHPSVPATTVPEFIAYAKANPGMINIASAGNGTPQHVAAELFKMMTGVNMLHVPYRGAAPALTDLIGGQVQAMIDTTPASIEYIRTGKLRPLAVTTATRADALPDLRRLACRFGSVYCRGNQEVGQGDQVLRRQGRARCSTSLASSRSDPRRQGRRQPPQGADAKAGKSQRPFGSKNYRRRRFQCIPDGGRLAHKSLEAEMRRREFIAGLGSTAAWPIVARAQQSERMRRIGMLLPATAEDSEFQARVGAFQQGLALLGWTIGRNVRIDTRWAGSDAGDIRRQAAELVALAPDVILAHNAAVVTALLQLTHTVPIVFPIAVDPVGRRPGRQLGAAKRQCNRVYDV
jgi:tripartite-type tricarboxylate transporter receptor subunit TctC